MKNYLSFSLWGDDPIYNVGIIKNAELWRKFYPDWQMIVYYDNSVPKTTLDVLLKHEVLLVDMSNKEFYGMFWRFLALDIPDANYVIFRDADSRLSLREQLAVDEWIKSGKSLHIMRDHPYHMIPCGNDTIGILGGMWGFKSGKVNMIESLKRFPLFTEHNYGNDQTFLKFLFQQFLQDSLTHDEFFMGEPFPIPRKNGRFIGERINIDENPLTNDCDLVNQKISVIIPTYNRYDSVIKTIESVINQTYNNIEIIVIDDCSDDERYINLKENKNILYHKLNTRTGLPSKVRNYGIKMSTGNWIAFLDDDDTWDTSKLEIQMQYAYKYGFVCSDALSEGNKWAKGIHIPVWERFNPNNNTVFDYDLISRHNFIINSSVLVKKDLLLQVGLISENPTLRGVEDYDCWKKLLQLGVKCFFIEKPLINYEVNSVKYYKDNYIKK